MATEPSDESSLQDDVAFDQEDAFIHYLARRLRIETSEARARLSAWLSTYEPPMRSGVRRAAPLEDEALELERSA